MPVAIAINGIGKERHVRNVGGRVAIAYGRDAADVAIYTQFGDPVPLLRMEVMVERL